MKDIKKEIIAFANTRGWKIYIDIDDGNIIELKNSESRRNVIDLAIYIRGNKWQ